MPTGPDLDAYFERIQWNGSTDATYATLAGLLAAHVSRIPFENLDVLLGNGVRLDLPALEAKLVRGRRGGYCFEHATLFAAVLEALGFDVARHTARVVLVLPRHLAPRGHMCLTVRLPEGTFVVDPGFGGLAPRVPVPLAGGAQAEGAPAQYGDEVHWMVRDGGAWVLRTRVGDKTSDCWIAELAGDNLIDFEVGNHWAASYRDSPFVHRMMLRAYTPEGRVGVMNRDVTELRGGTATTRVLPDRGALRTLLREAFGFDLPAVERLRVPAVPEWSG